MTVRSATRTLTVPAQRGPVEPPPAAAPRPPMSDERQFVLGVTAMGIVLSTIIVVFLLLADRVWG